MIYVLNGCNVMEARAYEGERQKKSALFSEIHACGAEEQEGEWTGRRIPAHLTSFLRDESGVERKKMELHSCFMLGTNPQKGYPLSWKFNFFD